MMKHMEDGSDADIAMARKAAATAIRHGRVYRQAINTMYQEGLVNGLYKMSHDLRGSLRRQQNEEFYKSQHIIAKKAAPDEDEAGMKARKEATWKPFNRNLDEKENTGHAKMEGPEVEDPHSSPWNNPEEHVGSASGGEHAGAGKKADCDDEKKED